jgi:hypothetical protein
VPFVQSIFANTLQPGMFPTGAFQQFSNQSTSGLATYVEFNPKRDYVMQWNLGVARELTSTLVRPLNVAQIEELKAAFKMEFDGQHATDRLGMSNDLLTATLLVARAALNRSRRFK